MTRDQDLERQLADWLVDGPTTAPAEAVDQALEQTIGRRQRHGAWRLLALSLTRPGRPNPGHRIAGVSAAAAVLVGILLTTVIVFGPFLGGDPGPVPPMDVDAIRPVAGVATMGIVSETPTDLTRSITIETGDPRIDGHARQELTVLARTGEAAQMHGTMRLQNDWGTWEGPVDIVRYPAGEEYEYASLTGSGAYESFTFDYTVRQATAEAEPAVEGAIWPDEPPPLPDPSLLP